MYAIYADGLGWFAGMSGKRPLWSKDIANAIKADRLVDLHPVIREHNLGVFYAFIRRIDNLATTTSGAKRSKKVAGPNRGGAGKRSRP